MQNIGVNIPGTQPLKVNSRGQCMNQDHSPKPVKPPASIAGSIEAGKKLCFPGAFRRFKEMVYELGLAQGWYAFRDAENKKIAVEWCRTHGLDYKEE